MLKKGVMDSPLGITVPIPSEAVEGRNCGCSPVMSVRSLVYTAPAEFLAEEC